MANSTTIRRQFRQSSLQHNFINISCEFSSVQRTFRANLVEIGSPRAGAVSNFILSIETRQTRSERSKTTSMMQLSIRTQAERSGKMEMQRKQRKRPKQHRQRRRNRISSENATRKHRNSVIKSSSSEASTEFSNSAPVRNGAKIVTFKLKIHGIQSTPTPPRTTASTEEERKNRETNGLKKSHRESQEERHWST